MKVQTQYRGQRFAVTALHRVKRDRWVVGWTNAPKGGDWAREARSWPSACEVRVEKVNERGEPTGESPEGKRL